jgi:probable HAF family extracellular repeat protein
MKSRILIWSTAQLVCAALAITIGLAAQDKQGQHPKHHQYKLIDMGTFGGPASYIEVNGSGNQILNNRGIFTGSADTSTPDPYAPNCYDTDCYVSHAFEWKNGVVTDLGVLPGGYSSATGGINERGWIVGQSQDGLIDPLISFPETRAVLWTSEGITDLGTLGGNESLAVYVNNGGQVIGLATNATPDPYSLFGWGAQIHTFLWENGVMQNIGTLGGPDAVPSAGCNNQRNGLIAGASYINFTPNPTTGVPTIDPFLWRDGTMLDLGTLGGTNGFAQCVNNKGQVAGQSNLTGDLIAHPFVWDKGVLTDLGTLGGDTGTPYWLNDAEEVVGEADLAGDQVHHAFLWKNSTMTDLGTVNGTPCSNAFAINSEDQIVGNSTDCHGVALAATLWENGSAIDLNQLIPPNSSLQLVNAEDINEQGEIAGVGVPPGCQATHADLCGHAYLLIPNGECDDACEGRMAASQKNAAIVRQNAAAVTERTQAPLSPIERMRNQLRQRYHVPGQQLVPRD